MECKCHKIGLRVQEPQRVGLDIDLERIGLGYMPSVIIGKGGSKAIEQWMLMPEACGLEVIPTADVLALCNEQWRNPSAPDHQEQTIATVTVEKSDEPVEEYLQIPDQIDIVAMSQTELLTMLNDIRSALIA